MVWFCTASGWDQSLNASVNVRRAARAHRFRQVRLDLAAQTPLIPPRPDMDHRLPAVRVVLALAVADEVDLLRDDGRRARRRAAGQRQCRRQQEHAQARLPNKGFHVVSSIHGAEAVRKRPSCTYISITRAGPMSWWYFSSASRRRLRMRSASGRALTVN